MAVVMLFLIEENGTSRIGRLPDPDPDRGRRC